MKIDDGKKTNNITILRTWVLSSSGKFQHFFGFLF